MRAWHQLFSAYLAGREGVEAYTESDYFDFIDGKPRYDGVRSLLASRGITLPNGDPHDDPEAETICGLGNRKNDVFSSVLAEDGVRPYPGSLTLLDHLADRGTKMAVVSSSRNAPAVLAAAGLEGRFGVVVDGSVATSHALAGKPSAETFTYAARALAAAVERSVVLEDALSGVAAGHAGGFGLVVGVDRGAGADRLTEAGAGLVVADLAELVPA